MNTVALFAVVSSFILWVLIVAEINKKHPGNSELPSNSLAAALGVLLLWSGCWSVVFLAGLLSK